MQVNRVQRQNQNFRGLIKFDNCTINPNHIIKSKISNAIRTFEVNEQDFYGYQNNKLNSRFFEKFSSLHYQLKEWFKIKGRSMFQLGDVEVLINDSEKGLMTKTFKEEYFSSYDKKYGFQFHNLKLLEMNGKFQMSDGKTYEFQKGTQILQAPTAKEINVTQDADKAKPKFQENYEPFITNKFTSWEELWLKAMKEDTIIDMNTKLKESSSSIDLIANY